MIDTQDKEIVGADAGAAPAAAAAATDKPKEGAAASPTAADLRKMQDRLDRLAEQVETANNAAIHWHDAYTSAANNGHGKPAEADPAADPGEAEEDVIDAITAKGWKAIDARIDRLVKGKNFVDKDEFDRRADARIGAVSEEAELRKRYPDLDDRESPLFEETARQYRALEGVVKGPKRLTLAAEKAELALRKTGKWQDKDQADDDREARGRAQAGEGGRRSARESDTDAPMTPWQKKVCEELGVSEAAYEKRAKEGIRFSSMGGRR